MMAQAGATLITLGMNPEEEFTTVSQQTPTRKLKAGASHTCKQASVAQLGPDVLQDLPRGRGSLQGNCKAKGCRDVLVNAAISRSRQGQRWTRQETIGKSGPRTRERSSRTSSQIHFSQLDLSPGLHHVKRQCQDSSDLQSKRHGNKVN